MKSAVLIAMLASNALASAVTNAAPETICQSLSGLTGTQEALDAIALLCELVVDQATAVSQPLATDSTDDVDGDEATEADEVEDSAALRVQKEKRDLLEQDLEAAQANLEKRGKISDLQDQIFQLQLQEQEYQVQQSQTQTDLNARKQAIQRVKFLMQALQTQQANGGLNPTQQLRLENLRHRRHDIRQIIKQLKQVLQEINQNIQNIESQIASLQAQLSSAESARSSRQASRHQHHSSTTVTTTTSSTVVTTTASPTTTSSLPTSTTSVSTPTTTPPTTASTTTSSSTTTTPTTPISAPIKRATYRRKRGDVVTVTAA